MQQRSLFFVVLVAALCVGSYAYSDSPSFPSFTDMAGTLNYPVESHDITTSDGYVLTFFRLQSKNSKIQSGLPVIYLQHGLLNSADTWITNDEQDAPGFVLANRGYDVWVGNVRGTKYGMKHVNLSPNDHAFWQFTWQNYTDYDLPAAFEYIHQATGQMINYIGHSQGTLMMFAALSDGNPTVLKYLKKYVALSPVAWVAHMKSGPVELAAYTPILSIWEAIDDDEFLPPNYWQDESLHVICKTFTTLCEDTLGTVFGFDSKYDNAAQYNIILEHEPGGTSVQNMAHWRQMVLSGKFIKYDYGKAGNLQHYNQATPPEYNVGNIKFPVHLFFGKYDDLVDPRDTQTLLDHLTNAKVNYKEYPAAHMTFIWSKDISFYLNDLLAVLKSDDFEVPERFHL